MESLLAKGASFAASLAAGATDTAALLKKVWELRPCGTTALGPALAMGVGLCSRGGRVVVCTDGLANQGVGSVNSAGVTTVPFYADVAKCAVERGIVVSMVTIEGEECAMEHLGTTADITGGQVEIVDPVALESKVAGIVAQRTLATQATVSVRGSGGLLVDAGAHASRELGAISSCSDICFSLEVPTDAKRSSPRRIQVQLRYTARHGGEYLAVAMIDCPVTSDRHTVEQHMRPEAVAVAAVQRAARFAQEGEYRTARADLISTQRLLQRGMRSSAVQQAYLPFIVQAEKLDQFIREREAQELIGARSTDRRRADRDDEAARAMYQMKSLSLASFLSGK